MRLICPSCGAQYEVDESVIPEAGRDVQCSNCGHAWFQISAAQLRARETQATEDVAGAEDDTEEWVAEESPEETGEAEAEEVETVEAGTPVAAEVAPPPAPEPRPDPEPKRKTLDDAVMNVLREEADRERRAREAEGSLVETQPDAGIAAAGPAAPVAAAAVAAVVADSARADEAEEPDGDDLVVSRASRRELLPDIEEINSTLRATSDRGGEAASLDAPETLRRRRSGFRMGFSTAILIAAVLLLLYALAPTIAARAPASASVMQAYVASIDGARGWLDRTLQGLTASMKDGSQ